MGCMNFAFIQKGVKGVGYIFGVSFLWFGSPPPLKRFLESHSHDLGIISNLKFHFQVMLGSEDENWAQTPPNAGSV